MNISYSVQKSIRTYVVLGLILVVMTIIFVAPFLWVISLSFDADASVAIPYPPRLIPEELTLQNYSAAIQSMNLLRVYTNTFLVLLGVNLVGITSSFLAGYAISKIDFKGKRIVFLLFLSTLMLPMEVRVFPLYMILKSMGLINTFWCFWLPAAGNGYMIFLAKSSMDSIPDSLREAGLIDGAGDFWIFRKIFLPLSKNGVVTVIILLSMGAWNDLLYPMVVLTRQNRYTIQVMLSTFKSSISGASSGAAFPGMTMAGTVLSIIPMLIMYLFLQKYIIQSVAMSGIKQ